jgi:hypothetical protein
MQQMVIANALRDGLVVFLAADGRWVNAIADGAVASDTDRAQRLADVALKAEQRCEVIGPELIEIEIKGGLRQPVQIREAIRAHGPIVRGHPGENDESHGI